MSRRAYSAMIRSLVLQGMIQEKVDKEILVSDGQTVPASNKREAHSQFQEKLSQVVE